MKILFNSKKGFSLVELLVAATIIGLLAASGMVAYTSANRNARDAKRKSDLEQVRAAIELYRTEEGCYPLKNCNGNNASGFDELLEELNDEEYLNNIENITDPKASPHPQYGYNKNPTNCSVYELTARIEKNNTNYSLCNP